MRQTENDHNEIEKLTEVGVKEGGETEKPRSWREYIEETEAAEKKAEREAAKERAAQIKKEKRSAAALAEKAKAAFGGAKAAGNQVQEEPAKERAARAVEAVRDTVGDGWARVCDATIGAREAVGGVFGAVRTAVERHPISPLLYLTLLAVAAGVMFFRSTYTRAYAVSYNGQEIAVLSSEEDVDAIVSNVESRASDILGEKYDYDKDQLSTTPVYVTPDEITTDTTGIEDVLFEDVGAWIQAYTLKVDGVELGSAATQEELQALLDEAAAPYLTKDTVNYEFVEDVEIALVEMPSNSKFDVEPIRETLAQLRIEQSVYVVKKGDTFNAIAYSLDMWPNELSVLNPDVMVDKIWVGDELIIQEAVPFLSEQNFTDETYEDVIPSPVEYIETPDLYVGDTRVKEQGEDGLGLFNARATYVNGVEVEREIISTEVLVEPTTTYTYTGTTPRPVTASNGYFIWPVRGTITSNFGGRNLWGRYDFHLGLDIACPTGTSIKAADGGTVIKAGWNGSYGNLVAIRHDNGYVTYYAHNSSILVSVGQKVYQGQIIARAGSTGNSSGNHCHFEVRVNNTSVNPRNYLS